jgi:hypothetical protein
LADEKFIAELSKLASFRLQPSSTQAEFWGKVVAYQDDGHAQLARQAEAVNDDGSAWLAIGWLVKRVELTCSIDSERS